MSALGYGLAILIGLSLGLLGGGGSILTVPVLVYVLAFPVKEAVPMSLAVVGTTSLFGAVSHHRRGNIRWDAALGFGPAAVLGAFLGGRVGLAISGRLQLMIFATLMLAAAVSMYVGPALWGGGKERDERVEEPRRRRPLALMLALGLIVGGITGLVGIGGGFLYVPALVLIAGVGMKQGVGTSLVLIIMSCISGLVSYLGAIRIAWLETGIFTGLAIVGVLLGSALAERVSAGSLRKTFAVLLLAMGILVFLKPR